MYVIGITGGVGAGKSELLKHIEGTFRAARIDTDRIANEVKEPGGMCYNQIVCLLGDRILLPDGQIDRAAMAGIIFADKELLRKVNAVLHPAVREIVEERIRTEKSAGRLDFLFIEAALLIEAGYEEILDELWYVHAEEAVRRKRLAETRGYSDEKIAQIFQSQLKEEVFRAHADRVIDNSGALRDSLAQADRALQLLLSAQAR